MKLGETMRMEKQIGDFEKWIPKYGNKIKKGICSIQQGFKEDYKTIAISNEEERLKKLQSIDLFHSKENNVIGIKPLMEGETGTRKLRQSKKEKTLRIHCAGLLRRMNVKLGHYPFKWDDSKGMYIIDLSNPINIRE